MIFAGHQAITRATRERSRLVTQPRSATPGHIGAPWAGITKSVRIDLIDSWCILRRLPR